MSHDSKQETRSRRVGQPVGGVAEQGGDGEPEASQGGGGRLGGVPDMERKLLNV